MRASRLGRSIAVSICAVNLLLGASASAHPEFNPITTNRYLKIDLISGHQLRLAYTLMYGESPAAAARKAADANADGQLDAAETAALGQRLRERVAGPSGLSLAVDGVPATLAFEPPTVGLMGTEVGPSPFSIDLVARIDCPGAGPHQVRLDDQLELGALGETEIRIDESPATTLLASFRGAPSPADGGAPATVERKFLFHGARRTSLEDRSITFRFSGGNAPAATSARAGGRDRWPWFAGGLALLLMVGVFGYRRMKG